MRGRIRGAGAVIPVAALIILVGISPFFLALWNSLFHGFGEGRTFVGLGNYTYITGDRGFPFSLNITVLWAVSSTLLTVIFGFLTALHLVGNRCTSGALFRSLLIPWGIPVYIAVPLWRALLHGNGGESIFSRVTGLSVNLMINPTGGFLGALAVDLWMGVPLAAFVMAAHIRQIPSQIVEAASIDGASRGQIARYIYLPAIKASLLVLGLRGFIKAFKEFTVVFLMTSGGPPLIQGITERHVIGATTTLGIFLYEVFQSTGDWGITSAYAMIMSLIVLPAMAFWAALRRDDLRDSWLRIVVLLAMVSQLPGRDWVLWAVAAAYGLSLWIPRISRWTLFFHLGYQVYRVSTVGYLAGFHPGVLAAAVAVAILVREERRRGAESPSGPLSRLSVALSGTNRRVFGGRGVGTASTTVAVGGVVVTVVILYLLLWMSLSRISAVYMETLLPAEPTGANFLRLFSEEGILLNFRNTAVIAGITAILVPIVTFPTAVWLHERGHRAVILFIGTVQLLEIAGGMHSLIPLYRLFIVLGLIDTYIPLILIYLYHALPFTLFILTAYLSTVPSALRDIARIEGVSDFRYAYLILLPLSLPALLTTVMSAFIGAWNGFLPALLFLNDERLYPISMRVYGWVGNLASATPVWNLFAAASVVNTALIMLLLLRFRNPMQVSPLTDFPE